MSKYSYIFLFPHLSYAKGSIIKMLFCPIYRDLITFLAVMNRKFRKSLDLLATREPDTSTLKFLYELHIYIYRYIYIS